MCAFIRVCPRSRPGRTGLQESIQCFFLPGLRRFMQELAELRAGHFELRQLPRHRKIYLCWRVLVARHLGTVYFWGNKLKFVGNSFIFLFFWQLRATKQCARWPALV